MGGHYKCLIDKFLHEPDKALFYVREAVKNGWSARRARPTIDHLVIGSPDLSPGFISLRQSGIVKFGG